MAERDTDYDAFHAKWKPRLGLKDAHIALGYMRGLGDQDGTLPDDPSKIGIHIRVDGRGLDAQADPGALDGLIATWAVEIEDEADPRELTKTIIVETIALNMHYGERGPKIVGAALWLAAANGAALPALREPGTALLCEFIYDEREHTRRMRLVALDR